MIELEIFSEEDFDRLISWVKTEEDMIQFAGPAFNFPITHEQLLAYNDPNIRQVFKVRLNATDEIIGHCEINYKNSIPRLSRILIGNKEFRNKGLGKEIVKKLLDIVFSTTLFEIVDLSVFDWNENAIASYQKVGFKINTGFETQMAAGSKTWTAINMIIKKDDYLKSNLTI